VSFRVVSQGAPPVVVCYLVGSEQDAKLRAALPGCAIVATHEAPLHPTLEELHAAMRLVGLEAEDVCLVGYSAGCQSVRSLLWERGVRPLVTVTIDGTHAAIKPPAAQIDVWRALAEEARAGRCMWVATCTQQTYTELLTLQRDGHEPFMATVHVLERVLDMPLPAGLEVHEGHLHVLSYDSARIDGEAHKSQLREVLPHVLAEYVAPYLVGDEPTTDPGSTALPWMDPALPLGERALLLSIHEMESGVREEPPGSNTGVRIREYLAPAHRDGKFLGLEAAEWCAAAACWTAYTCLGPYTDRGTADRHDDEVMPHAYRVSGIEIEEDAKRNGTWWPAKSGYRPRRGDLALYKRGSQAWQRHVVRVEVEPDEAGRFRSVGGNEKGNAWQRTPRRMDDADLLGFVEYPTAYTAAALPAG